MSLNDSDSLAIVPKSEMRSKGMPQVEMFVDCAGLSMSRQDLLDEHHELGKYASSCLIREVKKKWGLFWEFFYEFCRALIVWNDLITTVTHTITLKTILNGK